MKKLALALIKLYRRTLSKTLFLGTCRFIPTCSEYTYEAIERYGIIRGSFLGLKRILRCQPWNKGGIDRVPTQ